MSGNGKNGNSFDAEKYRVSEQEMDRGLRDLAGSLKTQTDKDGNERVWGFKVPKAAAFVINSAYDQFVVPWTRDGAKAIYDHVYKFAQRYEQTSGSAHTIANGVALGIQLLPILGKPLAEFVSINKQHYGERYNLYKQVSAAIDNTPADYSKNEVVMTAFSRVNGRWSRDLMRKVPDLAKVTLQSTLIYNDHKADMAKKLDQINAVEAMNNPGAAPVKDTAMESLESRFRQIDEMQGISDKAKERLYDSAQKQYDTAKGFTDSSHTKGKSKDGKHSSDMAGLIGFATEVGKVAVGEYIEKPEQEGDTAWDKIQILKNFMNDRAPEENPDRIRVNGVALKKFIVDIFQQNEIDRGRGRMGETLVEELMPAVNKIAEGIADTTLDANALVHLVGDHQIIRHEGAARIFASEEKVEEVLNDLKGVNTSKEKIDMQEFFSSFADPLFAKEVVKTNVASLDGNEKALFVAIFPDELLQQAGMTKEAITNERKIAHEFIYDVVVADTIELAKKSPEELRKLGLAKKDIAAIQELASDIERGQEDAVRIAVDGADRTVVSAIRTAALHRQIDEKGEAAEKIWTDMVRKGSSLREKIENGELRKGQHKSFAEKEKPHDEPMHDDHHASRGHDDHQEAFSAAKREEKRRSKGGEPHEGIGVA